MSFSESDVHGWVVILDVLGELWFAAGVDATDWKNGGVLLVGWFVLWRLWLKRKGRMKKGVPGPMSHGFVVSVLNLYLQEMHRKRAKRSAEPLSANGRPCVRNQNGCIRELCEWMNYIDDERIVLVY